ncbi:hypothetical protein PVK63_13845 [Aliivibrio sp. S2TY2]|uniref:hypothetical protein n=1 Tax=unclassified Aliivibrio TaxID=2645654 RepID=UPI002378EF6B|nr:MULTISPECIES: hypothetical protein [unclassified Aliivibrio]MDD9176061.1 hypothetical protein [Aliivibrio sp. S3TY1]MDD9193025.1 hypothetical protein [Aliivibrio sp. S2TY2]
MDNYSELQQEVLHRLASAHNRGVMKLALSDLIILVKNRVSTKLESSSVISECDCLLGDGMISHKFIVYSSFYSLTRKGLNAVSELKVR